jgi:hypothetical protein
LMVLERSNLIPAVSFKQGVKNPIPKDETARAPLSADIALPKKRQCGDGS